jgi:hypothetical protein
MRTRNTIKTAALAITITLLAILPIYAQIHLQGIESNHEGLVAWDTDGTGDENEAHGHHFEYGDYTWYMAYYVASRDYNNTDPHTGAAMCRFTDETKGFPNLKSQMTRLGFTMDQLKIKSGISSLGNDIEGSDWGLNGNIHWYRLYGNTLTIEIAGQSILQCTIDTNYCYNDLDDSAAKWHSYTSYAYLKNTSSNVTTDAQRVANAFLKDLDGRPVKLSIEGTVTKGKSIENGRNGIFHEINTGTLTPAEAVPVHAATKDADISPKQLSSKTENTSNIKKHQIMSFGEVSVNPNPFRNRLNVKIDLAEADNIKLEVYNFLGKKVASLANEYLQNGKHEFEWNAGGLPDGIYFCRLQAGDATITKKIIKTN